MEYKPSELVDYLRQFEIIDISTAKESVFKNELTSAKKEDRLGDVLTLNVSLVAVRHDRENAKRKMREVKSAAIYDMQQLHREVGLDKESPPFHYQASNGYVYVARLTSQQDIEVEAHQR